MKISGYFLSIFFLCICDHFNWPLGGKGAFMPQYLEFSHRKTYLRISSNVVNSQNINNLAPESEAQTSQQYFLYPSVSLDESP